MSARLVWATPNGEALLVYMARVRQALASTPDPTTINIGGGR